MKTFRFKNFTLYQERAALKVGTDSLVLAALVTANHPQHILDIGSGTGVLSFLMAQCFPQATIHGVELDEHAIEDALQTQQDPFFNDRDITFEQADFSEYEPSKTYDLVVSNPPYFISSTKNSDLKSTQARHTDRLHPNELFARTVSCLSKDGALWIIYPIEFQQEFENAATTNGLFAEQVITIFGKPLKSIRKVTCFKRSVTDCCYSDFTIRNEDGSYSEQYKTATIEFHDRKL